VDLTLEKIFKIGEGQHLRFRKDFFNLFNYTWFANPPFSSGCGAGGRIGGGRFRADQFRGGYTTADPVFVEVFVLKTSRNATGRTRRHKTLGLKLQRSAGLHALFICQPEGLLT
jgi:hypothetical protein